MKTFFDKLGYKNQDKIYVIGTPKELKPILEEMKKITKVKSSPNCKQEYEFALFFVKDKSSLAKYADKAAQKVPGDGLLWFAYPKMSSKKYKPDLTSDDSAWNIITEKGFKTTKNVSINEDWSAIQFKRVKQKN